MILFGLLLLSLLLSLGGAVASLLLHDNEAAATRAAGYAGAAAAIAALALSVPALTQPPSIFTLTGPFPFAHLVLRLDPLAALMIAVIALLSLVGWIYSLAYVSEYSGRGIGAMGFFMNLFIGSMVLVVLADNAFWFLVFFEMMSLSSYFLVIFNQDEEAVSAGFVYFFVAHAGSVLVMVAFFMMANTTGSFDFAAFRSAPVPAPYNSIAFLLGFVGFGAKAGMMPLHMWLPRAHPAAPSHASALMSGVMIKIGVFGIIKVGIDLLGGGVLWWGVLVLACGAVSAVIGILYAMAERDIKRLLAYSSVENVGIILLGVGTGMIGIAAERPVVAVLGLTAALFHLVNHAVFKGLLFLGAGSVIYRMHTKDMEAMGGLSGAMPWTALAFLIGALAISGVPPLNGFVSEWYGYQALFTAATGGGFLVRFATPIAAMLLALTGALAMMCFVKAYGVVFSGAPRSPHAAQARDVPLPMIIGMAVLAACCLGFGLLAPVIAPLIACVAASSVHTAALAQAWSGAAGVVVADGAVLVPGDPKQAVLSTPLIAVLLLTLAMLPVVIKAAFAGSRAMPRRTAEPWAAGYLPDVHMPVTGRGFVQPILMFFRPLYDLHDAFNAGWAVVVRGFDSLIALARRVEPTWDRGIIEPIVRGVQAIGERMQAVQGGDLRYYCLYIIAALVVLLALAVA
jgi:hydrogenase-4 component B